MKRFIQTSILLLAIGCASNLKPVSISSSANPSDEITNQRVEMDQAKKLHVNILASENFNEARTYLSKAVKENKAGKPSAQVLKTLGYAKAHLQQAQKEAAIAYAKVEEITKSRDQAITAGANQFPEELSDLDQELKEMTEPDQTITQEDKNKLQSRYLALELRAIKQNKLGKIKEVLEHAKKKDAETNIPKAYAEAIQKFTAAEKLIETSRHNNFPIDSAVAEANFSATRVMNLMISEKKSRNQTPEQRAVSMEVKDQAVKTANSNTFAAEVKSMHKDHQLAEQSAILAVTEDENMELKRNEYNDQVVADAAARFNKAEADVYRQDGMLIIRLKTMNFASGRADLPANSMAILARVKDVLKDINAGDVMVEGHTDGTGPAVINQKLSEKRAQAVVKFFAAEEMNLDSKIKSKGFGYSKPLATNKTEAGRAQNRRVDILVKTHKAL